VEAAICLFVATLTAYGLCWSMSRFGGTVLAALRDHPTHRSLHQTPRLRAGGLAIAAAALAGAAICGFTASLHTAGLVAATLLVISLVDDIKRLSAAVRLAAHLALVAVYLMGLEQPMASAVTLFVGSLLGAWMTNLYNFMDGADGLAGGMAVIGFAAFALALGLDHEAGLGLACALLSAASLGFLVVNFPRASIFLGDAGSIPLGFLVFAMSVETALSGELPFWFGAVVFSPFIVDATVTLLRRMAGGHAPWIAHRDHYYQRLILSGWSHRKTCLAYYFLMLSSAVFALFAKNLDNPWAALTAVVITYVLLVASLERRFHKEKQRGKKS
jgi:UDP-N-acetylmuramyl pentapeptide phosphotransferase/UDP-N-acetylglucosamine-1-phosphate transferase